ncbi:MAG: DUF5723 family protein [Flavobacteriales bacterium]|nr:DUF5723 family protein [Flavobacteriales bacterium]
MSKKIFLLALVHLVCFGTAEVMGQFSGQIGEYDFLPQRVTVNPALRPAGKVNIGIPAVSNIYFEQSNNWIKPAAYLAPDAQGVVTIDDAMVLGNIDDEAFTGFGFSMELLHVGLRFGDHYFYARVSERVQGGIGLPRDLFALGVAGNVGDNGFSNHTADLTGLRVDFMHFREYAIGYNYNFSEKLTAGVTVKYLYGMEAMRTAESSLQLRTDPETYDLSTTGSLLINTAGLGLGEGEGDIRDDVGNYLFGLQNTGVAGDFGVAYRPIEKLQLEFSGLDLGFISWREDVANYGTESAEFAYDGVNFTEFVFETGDAFDDGLQDEIDRIADDAEEAYNFESTNRSFRSAMFGVFRYAASYELYRTDALSGRVWANYMHGIGHRNLPGRLSVGYSQRVNKFLQAGVHYSRQAGDGGFLGCGLTLNGGPVQFFAMVENLSFVRLSEFTFTDENDPEKNESFILPRNASDVRIQFGLNLTFGRKGEDAAGGAPMLR